MKKMLLVLTTIISSLNLNAQDQLIAHYPFYSSATDTTENYANATIINTNFSNGGIYSNGIYSGTSTQGSYINTPNITGCNANSFAVNLTFRIDSFPSGSKKPIIVCGSSWRWMTAYISPDSTLSLECNSGSVFQTSTIHVTPELWHDLILSYDTTNQIAKLSYDAISEVSANVPTLEHHNDFEITNENGGTGITFKGYWKDLKIINKQISTSIDEKLYQAANIYPNPNNGTFTIKLKEGLHKGEYKVYSGTGKLLEQGVLTANNETITTDNLQTGIYFLLIETDKNTSTQKLVIK